MKIVTYLDERGYMRSAMLRDNDPDHAAPAGIPLNPPDLDQIDWDEVKRELHNLLVERGLYTWHDVQVAQNGVSSSIQDVLKSKIIRLYKLMET